MSNQKLVENATTSPSSQPSRIFEGPNRARRRNAESGEEKHRKKTSSLSHTYCDVCCWCFSIYVLDEFFMHIHTNIWSLSQHNVYFSVNGSLLRLFILFLHLFAGFLGRFKSECSFNSHSIPPRDLNLPVLDLISSSSCSRPHGMLFLIGRLSRQLLTFVGNCKHQR